MRRHVSRRATAALAALVLAGATATVVGLVRQQPVGAVAGPAALSGTPLRVAHSGRCLNVAKASTADRAPVVQYGCVGAANERWRAVPQDDGSYQLVAEHSGKCLNVAGASTANGAPVVQYRCVGAANERWTPLDRPDSVSFTLVAQHSGKCLNVAGASTADGAAIVQYDCIATATNEIWSGTAGPAAGAPAAGGTVALQPQTGAAIALSFVDRSGIGWYGSTFPRSSSVTWQALPNEQLGTGTPALLAAGAGVQVLVRGRFGDVLGLLPPGRARWVDTGGPVGTDPVPPAGRAGPGPAVVAVGRDGRVWSAPDDGAHVPFVAWRPVGPAGFVDVAAGQARSGVQLFALQGNGALLTATLLPDGSLSTWTVVGVDVAAGFSVLTLPGYRYVVATRTASGAVQVKVQPAAGAAWPQAWTAVPGVTAAGKPALILPDDATGRISLVVRGTDAQVHVATETAQAAGTFGGWSTLPSPAVAFDPAPFSFQADGENASWGIVSRTADDETVLFYATAAAPAGFGTATLPAPRR